MLIPRTKFENLKGNFNFQIQHQLYTIQKLKFPFSFLNFVLRINIAFLHRNCAARARRALKVLSKISCCELSQLGCCSAAARLLLGC